MSALDDLIEQHGRTEFARLMNVTRAATYKWQAELPPMRAKEIQQTFGTPLWELRPDLWEPPRKKLSRAGGMVGA